MGQLGYMNAVGYGMQKNEAEAIKWYKLAAAQNDPTAQFNLGKAYYTGAGVPKDEAEAIKWFRLAADNPQDKEIAHTAAMWLMTIQNNKWQ